MAPVTLDLYGLTVRVSGDHPEVLREVQRDFAFFAAAPELRPALVIDTFHQAPPYERMGDLEASQYTPRNTTYRDGEQTWLDYFGRGLARVAPGVMEIWSPDVDLLREIVFLTLLSRSGEHLDARGLHRIHALGLSYRAGGVLVMMPSGGGKSTLALQMLQREGVSLLGEDSPLVDHQGTVHPFQLRLGIKDGAAAGIPAEHLRTVRRMEFDPKTLVDLDYFAGKLAGPAPAQVLLLGARRSGGRARVREMTRAEAAGALVRNMIVGLGLYQGVEFVLERSGLEVVGKAGVAASRARAGLALLRTCRLGVLELGRDRPHNADVLLEWLQRELR